MKISAGVEDLRSVLKHFSNSHLLSFLLLSLISVFSLLTFQRRGQDAAADGAGGAHSRLRGHHGEQEPQGVLPASSLMHSQPVQRKCKEKKEQTQVCLSLIRHNSKEI